MKKLATVDLLTKAFAEQMICQKHARRGCRVCYKKWIDRNNSKPRRRG